MTDTPRTLAQAAAVLVERMDMQRDRSEWRQAIRESLDETARLCATASPPRIVIEVREGTVQELFCDQPATILVLDYDPPKVGEGQYRTFPRGPSSAGGVADWDEYQPAPQPDHVDALFRVINTPTTGQPPADEIAPGLTEAMGGKAGLANAARTVAMHHALRAHGFTEPGPAAFAPVFELRRNGWLLLASCTTGVALPEPSSWQLSLYEEERADGGVWEEVELVSSDASEIIIFEDALEHMLDRVRTSPDRKTIWFDDREWPAPGEGERTGARTVEELKPAILALLSMIACEECDGEGRQSHRFAPPSECPRCHGMSAQPVRTIKALCAPASDGGAR